MTLALAPAALPAYPSASSRELFSLLKPGVMLLVVFTGATGMLLAPGYAHPLLMLIALVSIALGSGSGALINMWYDRDIDAIMHRTAKRPIPRGIVAADDVLICGIMMGLASVMLLGLATNWLAAGLLAFAIFFYAVIYTMGLKRRTPQNIVIGGAAGAFPPVIGWAAVTGDVTLFPVLLFIIIFLWTPPHFWALALYKNEDYRRAGVPMLPVSHGLAYTKKQMLLYTFLLAAACSAPAFLHYTGPFYAISSLILNALFIRHAIIVIRSDVEKTYAAMFGFSILYLFALCAALLTDYALFSF